MPLPITRQRRLCCLLAHRGILFYYPSWYALNGSNSSCLLLGGMSSQQDITPQKNMSRNPRIGFPFSLPPDHNLFYFWPMTHHSCIGWIQAGSLGFACAPLPVYIESLSAAHAFAIVWRLICAFYRSSLTSYGVNCFLIFHSLLACSFQGLGLTWSWVFPFLAHSLLLPYWLDTS